MLRLSDVSHVYTDGTKALEDVSLTLSPGMFGLLGPNGAGKSTLMRIVATLQAPSSGEIVFDGVDLVRDPEEVRGKLGYLPQDFGVYPRVSAYDMLDHLAALKGYTVTGERREVVEALLNHVNLWEVRRKYLSGFSGGMKQRFGIAQALIGDPRLLVVDEPTSGLDPQERNRFHDLLVETGERAVVILSTHIVEDVADLCPRMAVLAGGRIRIEGSPEELVQRERGRIWRKAIARADIDFYRREHAVISARLSGGRTIIHVLSDSSPGEGFVAAVDLEDVYFASLTRSQAAA